MEISLGFGEKSDTDFVKAFESCAFSPGDFHHADHLRLAWIYVKSWGAVAAEEKFLTGIRKLAIHAGAPEKFLYTTTVAWVRLVAARLRQSEGSGSFQDWIARWPELLNKNLLNEYYSPGKLESLPARRAWLEPDLKALI